MSDARPRADLARLVAEHAATVPAAQARIEALVEAGLRARATSPALRSLTWSSSVPRIARSDFAIETLVGTEQTLRAGLAVWPIAVGVAVLHGVRAHHAARIAFTVTAVPA
jgi:hypothetical protein